MSYNLDEAPESFEFILEGHTYLFRYPNAEEIAEAQKLPDEKANDYFMSFITAKDEGSPAITTVVKKVNLNKVKAFNRMIKTEFGQEE